MSRFFFLLLVLFSGEFSLATSLLKPSTELPGIEPGPNSLSPADPLGPILSDQQQALWKKEISSHVVLLKKRIDGFKLALSGLSSSASMNPGANKRGNDPRWLESQISALQVQRQILSLPPEELGLTPASDIKALGKLDAAFSTAAEVRYLREKLQGARADREKEEREFSTREKVGERWRNRHLLRQLRLAERQLAERAKGLPTMLLERLQGVAKGLYPENSAVPSAEAMEPTKPVMPPNPTCEKPLEQWTKARMEGNAGKCVNLFVLGSCAKSTQDKHHYTQYMSLKSAIYDSKEACEKAVEPCKDATKSNDNRGVAFDAIRGACVGARWRTPCGRAKSDVDDDRYFLRTFTTLKECQLAHGIGGKTSLTTSTASASSGK